jgi:hypothetical protein
VTYALCEAFAMTQMPRVEAAAEKAIAHVINGQNAAGGWDYNMRPVSARSDTSYMGWCVQALKAAKAARIHAPKLGAAMRRAISAFEAKATPAGGFGYTGPQNSGLTGVGVLCLQLLGEPASPYVRRGLQFLLPARLSWDNWRKQPYSIGKAPVYYWYYITQAKFHAGGVDWSSWNPHFNNELVRTQIPTENSYVDHEGKPQVIGHWQSPSDREHGPGEVMDTCLCALQLEVYYRLIPSYMKLDEPIQQAAVEPEPGAPKIVVTF